MDYDVIYLSRGDTPPTVSQTTPSPSAARRSQGHYNETKTHDGELVQTIASVKGSFWLIFLTHSHLPVPTKEV